MCINSLILQIILQTHTFLYNSLLIFKNIFVKNPKIKVFLREMSCWAGWYLRVFLPWPPQGGRQWPRALPQAVTRLVGFLTGAGHGGQGLLDLRQVRTYKQTNNCNTGMCQIKLSSMHLQTNQQLSTVFNIIFSHKTYSQQSNFRSLDLG